MQEVCSCGAAQKLAMLEEKIQSLERDLEEAQHNSTKELCFSSLHHCLCNIHSNVVLHGQICFAAAHSGLVAQKTAKHKNMASVCLSTFTFLERISKQIPVRGRFHCMLTILRGSELIFSLYGEPHTPGVTSVHTYFWPLHPVLKKCLCMFL